MAIRFQCTCGHTLTAPDKIAGRSAKCPHCDSVVAVPSREPIDEPPSRPAAASTKSGADRPPPADKCPKCSAELAAGAVLCVQCGFNLRSGTQMHTVTSTNAAEKERLETPQKKRKRKKLSRAQPAWLKGTLSAAGLVLLLCGIVLLLVFRKEIYLNLKYDREAVLQKYSHPTEALLVAFSSEAAFEQAREELVFLGEDAIDIVIELPIVTGANRVFDGRDLSRVVLDGLSPKVFLSKVRKGLAEDSPSGGTFAALHRLEDDDIKEFIPLLTKHLHHEDLRVRTSTISALSRFISSNEDLVPEFVKLLEDQETNVRVAAIGALGKARLSTDDELFLELMELLEDEESLVRANAINVLGKARPCDEKLILEFVRLLEDEERLVRIMAMEALEEAGPASSAAIPSLTKALTDPKYCEKAAWALVKIDPNGPAAKRVAEILIDDLADSSFVEEEGLKKTFTALCALAISRENQVRLLTARFGNTKQILSSSYPRGIGIDIDQFRRIKTLLGLVEMYGPDARIAIPTIHRVKIELSNGRWGTELGQACDQAVQKIGDN